MTALVCVAVWFVVAGFGLVLCRAAGRADELAGRK